MRENEDFRALGDSYYQPAMIRSLQEQAAEGKIPVSGAGYGGPFRGDGFDAIWTDMSEIVRPTRDGIHGREHISTMIRLGRKIRDLSGMEFDERGFMVSEIPPTREISLPILFDKLPFAPGPVLQYACAMAAQILTTYTTVTAGDDLSSLKEQLNHLNILMPPHEAAKHAGILDWATMIEFEYAPDVMSAVKHAHGVNPHLLTIVRVPVQADSPSIIAGLAQDGAEIIHLRGSVHGEGSDGTSLLSVLQESHASLVDGGIRDEVTLLASGGIASAEHVPKAILLGADAVMIDLPLLVAAGCTLCDRCMSAEKCECGIDQVNYRWAATRIVNLMLSWRDQLLEVLGAMGLRDVRRLRGERGRALFAADLEADFIQRLDSPSEKAPAGSGARRSAKSPAYVPGRFVTNPARYEVTIHRSKCTNCGLCVAACRYGVHRRTEGKVALDKPAEFRCIGPSCIENSWCCVNVCPFEAIDVAESSLPAVLGDRRWTSALIQETWHEAAHGDLPGEPAGGDSGGGFDSLRFRTRAKKSTLKPEKVSLSIPLNRRSFGPPITIPLPLYGGGMSFGSVSLQVMLGRAMAAREAGTFTCTGEGGYPDALKPFSGSIITQIATGLFGVREETIRRAKILEFKYAQGAKPGLGGHLLGEKNTPEVSAMREAVPGTSLFSPFPFHSVYSVEDHKKHLDWVRSIHPEAIVSVKVSTPGDVDMVAVGAYYAGANIIHLDGGYGGTGAAPDIAKKNIAQPIEFAVAQVHDFLEKEGIRDEIVLIASGGVRSPSDLLKAVALGADGVVIGTAELVAIGCVRCGNCERDEGCPIGIATTKLALSGQLTAEWVSRRILNMYNAWGDWMRVRLASLGCSSVRELRGRRDLLEYVSGEEVGN